MLNKTLALSLILVILSGCATVAPQTSAPDIDATVQAAVAATQASQPVDTPTPEPTSTAIATSTPTPIPDPPTATPAPIVLSGSGDSIVDVNKSSVAMIAVIDGNSESRYFSIGALDANNQQIGFLVSTTEPYLGVRPVDFLVGQWTKRFEIKTTGPWNIKLLSVSEAEQLSIPGEIRGQGDNVILLTGAIADLAKITGNAAGRYFSVYGYGNRSELLVSTTDPYEGEVLLSPDTGVLVVQAAGEWTITVTGK